MRVIFAKFPLLSKIQTLSHKLLSDKLLTTTIAIGMPKNLYAGFSSDFEQFFLVKNNFLCIFLKNKYGFQIACFKKIVESAHMPELKKLKTYS